MGHVTPSMGDDTDADTGDESFDLVIEDMDLNHFITLVGGLGTVQMQAVALGDYTRVEQAGELLQRILKENEQLSREALLHSEDAQHLHVTQMPDDTLDMLDIEIVDGYVRDARATEVDVE